MPSRLEMALMELLSPQAITASMTWNSLTERLENSWLLERGPILQLQDRIEGVDQECIDFFTLHAGVPPYAGGNNGLRFEFQRVSNNISLTGSFVKEGACNFLQYFERPQRREKT